MKKSRFTEEQIIGFLKQADAGMPVKELCRKGISPLRLAIHALLRHDEKVSSLAWNRRTNRLPIDCVEVTPCLNFSIVANGFLSQAAQASWARTYVNTWWKKDMRCFAWIIFSRERKEISSTFSLIPISNCFGTTLPFPYMSRSMKSIIWPARRRRCIISTIQCKPRKPASTALLTCSAWPSEYMRRSFKRPLAKSMVIRRCTRRLKPIGAM